MPIVLEIAGRGPLELHHLLLDVNGTLTDRGELLDGVTARIAALAERLEVRLLSADTFGTMAAVAHALGVRAHSAATSELKVATLRGLGPDRCAAIGNGANDAGMLAEAALAIAVIGPEGASGAAIASADIVTRSIDEALDLLLEPRALTATLRR